MLRHKRECLFAFNPLGNIALQTNKVGYFFAVAHWGNQQIVPKRRAIFTVIANGDANLAAGVQRMADFLNCLRIGFCALQKATTTAQKFVVFVIPGNFFESWVHINNWKRFLVCVTNDHAIIAGLHASLENFQSRLIATLHGHIFGNTVYPGNFTVDDNRHIGYIEITQLTFAVKDFDLVTLRLARFCCLKVRKGALAVRLCHHHFIVLSEHFKLVITNQIGPRAVEAHKITLKVEGEHRFRVIAKQ